MKKVIVLLSVLVLMFSCSVDDENNDEFHFEILPIASVEMPESFTSGEVYNITYSYEVPTSCHVYRDLYYVAESHIRTIAVINTVFEESNTVTCEDLSGQMEERTFQFYAGALVGSYVFRFWQGEDENGDDIYMVYEVPIE